MADHQRLVPVALNEDSTSLVKVLILTRKGLLLGQVRPWPEPKLVRVIQIFLRLLSTFLLASLTSMLRTS